MIMRFFNLLGFSLVFGSLLFVSINSDNMVFGETLDPSQNDSIELEGYFNILEIFYADGTYDMKYYLFVDNPLADNPTPYQLEFTNSNNSPMDFLGENVVVTGPMSSSVAQFQSSIGEVKIIADTIEKTTSNQEVQSLPTVAQTGTEGTPVPNDIQALIILSKFSNNAFAPHGSAYFDDLFFNSTVGEYSLTNYFDDASYGAVNITSAGVNDWTTLPSPPSVYDGFGDSFFNHFANDAINATESVHGPIDFDGVDNIVDNDSPSNLLKTNPVGDDIDHLTFIYNDLTFDCNCAFAFLGPHSVNTPSNGEMFLFVSYFPDLITNDKFSVNRIHYGGIGVPAHEYGHSFGWHHTPTPSPFIDSLDDPWSIMSKIANSTSENATGPIAYNRSHAKWISDADIIKVSDNQTATFTLDKLSDPSPGPGYLMANITFGNNDPSDFYTLEARIDDTFDHTPESKQGLLMYHISAFGHPGTYDTNTEASIVNVNNATDVSQWTDANLVLGQNFTVNNVTVAYLSHNATSITVEVKNNISLPSCTPPGVGDWVVTVGCTMTASASVVGNVTIQNGAVLTIPSGIILTIQSGFNANVSSGGGILINLGGTLIIIS